MGIVALVAAPAHAESCQPVMPDHARDIRGYTFEARVVAIRRERAVPDALHITMTVSKVHATPIDRNLNEVLLEGQTIELYSHPCDGFALYGIEIGYDILVSTHSLENPLTTNTAVWRRDGSKLHLLDLRRTGVERYWFTNDRRISTADTIREVLMLVAPSAIGMPDTSTEPSRAGRAPMLFVLAAGFLGLLASDLRFKSRSRRPERQVEVGGPLNR